MSEFDNVTTLRNLEITDIKENEHDMVVFATFGSLRGDEELALCPQCGTVNPRVHKNGFAVERVHDTRARGKRVKIKLKKQRIRCVEEGPGGSKCNFSMTAHPMGLHPERHMTTKCFDVIGKMALLRPFTHVAHHIGVDDKTVGNVCREYIAYLDRTHQTATPRYLGIDEVDPFEKRPALGVLTNIQEGTVIELLERCTVDVVGQYLRSMPAPSIVKGVSIDMSRGYANLAREIFPQADVIVDKFHVLTYASQAFETIRKQEAREMGTSTRWKRRRFYYLSRYEGELPPFDEAPVGDMVFESELGPMPRLRKAWWLYQRFYNIYDMDLTPGEAGDAFDEWRTYIPSEFEDAFGPLTRILDNWRDEILAYFKHGITNALTEQKNSFVRYVQRQGKGYSFEVLRGKVIYAPEHVHKAKFGVGIDFQMPAHHQLTYGAKISAMLGGGE